MRPFKEVILVNTAVGGSALLVTQNTRYKLKENAVHVLWRGSKEKFKKDFEIPEDAPLSTRDTQLPDGDNAGFVTGWNWTTLNFKFNYHIWYKDANTNYYVNGSNNTIDLTIPNVLIFDGTSTNGKYIEYATNNSTVRAYNPNLFRLPVGINTFITSNKVNDFTSGAPSGGDRDVYLIFRYGVGSDDIQICLLTKDSTIFNYNGQTLVMPYASLTFTGFNKIKRL